MKIGDRIRGRTATGKTVEGIVQKIGATALTLDCDGRTVAVSAASAELVCSAGEREQLTIFDALPVTDEAAPLPTASTPSYRAKHLQKQIDFYQQSVDDLIALSQQRWEAAQGNAEALAQWKTWAQTTNHDQVQRLLKLKSEAEKELETL